MAPIVSTPENPPPATAIVSNARRRQHPPRSPRARAVADQPIAQYQRVMDRLHAMDVRAQARREPRLRAGGDQQVIELDRARAAIEAIGHGHRPGREVHRRGLRAQELHPAQRLADRHDDRARVEASRRHLVQHRREEEEVLRVDEQHFDPRIARHRPLELERGVEAGESGPEDHDSLAFVEIGQIRCIHVWFL